MMNRLLLILVSSYLIGCFTTAYYLVRWRVGQDIRTLGSGNVGAKNAARVLGTWGFVVVFLGDAGKGVLAVWWARSVASLANGGQVEVVSLALSVATLAVVLGHLYPVQLGFRGGKGVATSFGAILIISPVMACLLLVVAGIAYGIMHWLGMGGFTASGLVAMATAPLIAYGLGEPLEIVVMIGILSLLLLYAHRSNLAKQILHSNDDGVSGH